MRKPVPSLSKELLVEVFNQTKLATAIHTGEDAVIEMANEAMIRIWGKDSSVIGKSLEDALPELKGQPFLAMFKKVWLEGIILSGTEAPADLELNGEIIRHYFDFEYRAIKNAAGETICILHTATDVTEHVNNREIIEQAYYQEQALLREQALNEELATANEELSAINEELFRSQEELGSLNEELERRVLQRVKDLSVSEEKFRVLSDELSVINEEMAAANEELTAANEALSDAQYSLQDTFYKLEEREIALRLAIEAANFGTWYLNTATMELNTSLRLKELFGFYAHEEFTLRQALDQISDEHREYVEEKLEKAIHGNGDYDVSYQVIGFHDQQTRWIRAMGNLKVDKSGTFSAFTGIVMDISPLKKDEQRKNDFIGMVSHELKTPLTSLNGYIQMLQRNSTIGEDSFVSGALEMAGKQVKKMTSMINGFLNVSRLESGKIVLNLSIFQLSDLIMIAIEEARTIDSSYVIHFEHCENTRVHADFDKISSVISNLLSNAIKYAPLDKVIQVKCEAINGRVQVSVKDNGIGISSKDVDRLFERYYRVDTGSHISGFGIGLYLSAEITARHDGEIWVESEPGNGSTFYFSLPLDF